MAKPTARARSGAQPPVYTTLAIESRDGVARVALARPQVHNAFDETSIAELTDALASLDGDGSVRAVVLAGEGASFCAGADLNWMRRMAGFSSAQNVADAKALAAMLATLDTMTKPTIARVHGAAYGGGVGLVACCDIAIAAPQATFALSEAKLGLIPATIGPYVVAAIGARHARRLFLTAERFDASEALRIGLVHEVAAAEAIDARIDALAQALLAAGPEAQREAKALVRAIAGRPIDAKLVVDTARRIARVRASAEGREGVAAFLDKRPPAWAVPPRKPS
jgi:methylglutaconyl-CoA hydratase